MRQLRVDAPVHGLHVLGLAVLFALLTPALAQAAPGDLDPSFGTGGKVTTDLGGTDDQIVSMALDSQGRIVAAGVGRAAYDATLARYRPNGSLDPSFGSDGIVTIDFGDGAGFAVASSVAIDPHGRIVVAGGSLGDFALARYHSDGSPDPSFGAGGTVTTDFGAHDHAVSVARDSRGRIIALGERGIQRGWFVLARYHAERQPRPIVLR